MNQKDNIDVTIEKDADLSSGRNNPALTEEFRDFGFGMFIHFGPDVSLGTVISHWMIAADDRLVNDFIDNGPKMFQVDDFNAKKWAYLARQAGAKYAVFTAKHHSGFCMWDTKTTPFNVMNTPFGHDLMPEYLNAFREMGVKPGLYFSPFDFYYNSRMKNKTLQFATPDMLQENDPEMLDYNTRQVEELMQNYGDIYCMFFDGPPDTLKATVWNNQKDCLITRGEMQTPENVLPEDAIDMAWEGCYTMGESWGYQPIDIADHGAERHIKSLIKIRARGGNMLLNVSPDPHGAIPRWQEEVLQTMGLFNFFYGEAIFGVRPCKHVSEEGEKVFYTQSKDGKTVYAFLMDGIPHFGYYGRYEIALKKVRATANTKVRMVGSNNTILEHRPGVDCASYYRQEGDNFIIDTILSMRPSENRAWKLPVVMALENVEFI